MTRVYILAGVRTPFGNFGGSLKDVSLVDLSAHVLRAVVERAGTSPGMVEEIFWGNGDTAEAEETNTPVVARQALLKAGFPSATVSLNMDRACCSGTAAIQMAWRALRSGEANVVIAGGAQSLSRTPFVLRGLRWEGKKAGPFSWEDPIWPLGYRDYNPVAVDAGEVAVEYGVGRQEQDEWAYSSQMRCDLARREGKFAMEIVPVEVPAGKGATRLFGEDEFPKSHTTLEGLAKLSPIFGSPTCTAGNSPGLNDGASAILMVSEEGLGRLGKEPLAEVLTVAAIASEPRLIPVVPALAIKEALRRVGLNLADLSLIEINEAFAAMPLVSTRVLAGEDEAVLTYLRAITNVNGGAIAIGHPLAASGARLVMTLAYELARRGGGYGVAAICGGLAQGDAVLVQVPDNR
ncbi:MAG: thiolase family protein [Clostridia bacterium]|nr:MAG: thiolase family protein [Clostridia bacterium]